MEEEQKKVSGAAVLPKVGWKGMLALAFGILFFAGVFATVQGAEWLKAFDYSTLIGKFGTMKDPAKATFVGMGGVSARGGQYEKGTGHPIGYPVPFFGARGGT